MANVLLADDSVTIHKVVEIILASKGFVLKAVDNGQSALEAMESFRPDIVLADVDMPGLNGYELAERIKQRPESSGIPVILLAGAFEKVDEGRMRSSGADAKLTKPFESDDLIGKINELISPAAAAASDAASAAPGEQAETLEVEGLESAAEEAGGLELVEASEEAEALEAMPGMSGFEPGEEAEELTALEAEPAEHEAIMAELAREVADAAGTAEGPEVASAEAQAEEPELTQVQAPAPVTAAIDPEEISRAVREAASEKIEEFLKSEPVMAMLSDTIEKVLWEITPEMTEKLTKQALKDSMATLSKELETIMWETVPDLADSLISAEIKRIRQET